MIHPSDMQTLERMFQGDFKVSEKLELEYLMRLHMYHSDGNSGPLGTLAMIDLVRFLGIRPKPKEVAQPTVDWSQVPDDGRAVVEARFFGDWVRGRYLGLVNSGGTLAVKLDGVSAVRECCAHMVRLVEVTDTVSVSDEVPPVAVDELGPPVEQDEEVEDEPEVEAAFDEEDTTDWSTVAAGSPVWVALANDLHDGKLVDVLETDADGKALKLRVQLEQEMDPVTVPAPHVKYVG